MDYKKYKRVFTIVIDSLGAGDAVDAAAFGDAGTDTLGHIAESVGNLHIPNLQKLGIANMKPLKNIAPIKGTYKVSHPHSYVFKSKEASNGKDTMYRHGEWDDEYTSHINHYVRLREEQARKYRAIMNRRKKEQEKKIVIDKTLDLFAKPNFRSRYPKELRLCIIIEHEHGVLGEIQVLLEVFLALRLVAHSVHKHTCVVVVVHHLRQVEFVHGGNGLLGCYHTFLIGLVVLLHALGEVDDRLVKMGAECKRIEGQLLRCAVEFGREHLLVQLATQAVEFGKSRGLRVGQGCLERSVGFVIKHKGSGLVVGLQQVVGLLHFVLHLPISIVLCSGAAGYQKQGGT